MEKDPNRRIYEVMKNMSYLTQVGLSIATPIVLCILGAVWLQNRFGLGGWVLILGILLGVGGGISSLFQLYRMALKDPKKQDGKGEK